MSSVIKECQKRGHDYFIVHSNQHYSESMDKVFFQDLQLPPPDYNLNVGPGPHSNQTGNILIKIEPVLEKERPNIVLVQGDTNTVLAAGLAASKLGIKVGHVEAGLRSYDRTMPEETNRIVVDHLSDYLFAVSSTQKDILSHEGVEKGKVYTVGNTVVDSLYQHSKLSQETSLILSNLGILEKEYFLATIHRSANVDNMTALKEVLLLLEKVAKTFGKVVVWPMHPRTKKRIKEFHLSIPEGIKIIDPLGYNDFLKLENNAKLILTDSGGVQEEACILRVPCLTIRNNTERPETVAVGANKIVGRDHKKAIVEIENFLNKLPNWENPFGNGTTSVSILDILEGDLWKKSNERVCVVGLGYMGLPMASLLAASGFNVSGVDIDKAKRDAINKGECPLNEPGLVELVKKAVHKFGMKAFSKPVESDVFIISVPTPKTENQCDLSYVINACESIVPYVSDGALVILESTMKPGTCRDIISPLFEEKGKKVLICHCPERAIPGNTLHEIINNDRLIGGMSAEAGRLAKEIYGKFIKGNLLMTDATTAECVKLMENTYRDVNIALANEFDLILQKYEVDSFEAIELANRHPRVNILSPGPGVGGHCIAVDPHFLSEGNENARLINLARKINDERPRVVAERVIKEAKKHGKKIGILGVAYKKNVDDCRETPALGIVEELLEEGLEVRCHDPFVKKWSHKMFHYDELENWSDLFVLLTDHDAFKELKIVKPLVDTRKMFN